MKAVLYAVLAIAVVNLLICGYLLFNPVQVTTEEKVVSVESVEYNDTALRNEIAEVKNIVNKDDNWEAEAIALAEAEYTNRHLYNALKDLNISIDDRDDIERYVVKDSEVLNADADEKDATVVEEVRVYYENSDGDSKRVTLVITSEIDDGEVVDTDYELA